MRTLVHAMTQVLPTMLNKRFAFFGHSMGALISFELAHTIRHLYGMEPLHLFASGRLAPQIRDSRQYIHKLPEPQFIEELRRLGGTPPEVLENDELLQMVLPVVRADFELIGTYAYVGKPKLSCPITAMGGIEDKDIPQDHIRAWGEQTRGPFEMCMFPGNHFFLSSQQISITRKISEAVAGNCL